MAGTADEATLGEIATEFVMERQGADLDLDEGEGEESEDPDDE